MGQQAWPLGVANMSEQRGHHRVVMVGPVMALSVFGVLQLWAAIRKERGQIKHLFMNVCQWFPHGKSEDAGKTFTGHRGIGLHKSWNKEILT